MKVIRKVDIINFVTLAVDEAPAMQPLLLPENMLWMKSKMWQH